MLLTFYWVKYISMKKCWASKCFSISSPQENPKYTTVLCYPSCEKCNTYFKLIVGKIKFCHFCTSDYNIEN